MEKPWMNAALSAEKRTELLLSAMTVKEKIAQLLGLRGYTLYNRHGNTLEITQELIDLYKEFPGAGLLSWNRADWHSKRGWDNGLTPELMPVWYNMIQKYAIEETRLGIPLLLGSGAIHGIFALGGSVFPTGIGLASTWNFDLLKECFDAIADEACACTAADGFSASGPTQDVARDPRWSRVEETYGEDPFLSAEMTRAFCEGMLMRRKAGKPGPTPAIRHFLAYGETEGGLNKQAAHCGDNELYNVHLRPFEVGFKNGASSVMTSYNMVNGIPCTISPLINDLIRGKWHWDGTVVSDAGAFGELVWQGFAKDLGDAAVLSLKAGNDMCCWETDAFKTGIKMALERGQLTEEDLNVHVRRILMGKFKSGIFEHPYIEDLQACVKAFRSPKSRKAALQAAREGIVLIKNENNTLPLKNIKNLSVIGPNADNMHNQIGDYTAPQRPGDIITVRAGLESSGFKVSYARGCKIRSMNKAGFPEALNTIDTADAVIVVIGGSSIPNMELTQLDNGEAATIDIRLDSEQDKDCGEGFDRASLHIGGVQLELLREAAEKAHAQGKKVVTVLIMGRPLNLLDVCKYSDAVLLAWYPGMEGGTAIAETLKGENNPSGRLPITFPDTEGQIPVYYNSLLWRKNYVDTSSYPTFRFGMGGSYTSFELSNVHVEKPEMSIGEENHVCVTVKNTGSVAGADVIQLYLHDMVFSVARPVTELKGFQKVYLKPGESKIVRFALTEKELGFYNAALEYVVEPGEFSVKVTDNGAPSNKEMVDTSFIVK